VYPSGSTSPDLDTVKSKVGAGRPVASADFDEVESAEEELIEDDLCRSASSNPAWTDEPAEPACERILLPPPLDHALGGGAAFDPVEPSRACLRVRPPTDAALSELSKDRTLISLDSVSTDPSR
jgi:hypothetical protein